MFKIEIAEESENKMTIRSSMFDAILSYAVAASLIAILIITIVEAIMKQTYLLLLVPFLIGMIIYISVYEGRLLNHLTIDKSSGIVLVRRIGLWKLGKKLVKNIDEIKELYFVHSNYSLRTDKWLIFVLTDEEDLINKKWRPHSYRIVFRDLWWPVYKDMPVDIEDKHRRIARFIGIKYRRRLVTGKGYREEIERF